ncbi:MAG TPA: C1 family peptidase [Candidatus Polarisedimenticolaceae bacterium]|nr:C1 family peptidase [Candidatus Polarisedimenticolaceae bacterium]
MNRRKLGQLCPVVPDRLDLRDRPYTPRVERSPKPMIDPRDFKPDRKVVPFRTRNQEKTNACTGFALAAVIEHLFYRDRRSEQVSPWMLYSMARRYDEFRGSEDEGSSLRGALKGWYKHGACDTSLWKSYAMPAPTNDPATDWWLDAAKRPLGAYFRVDPRSVTDMQSALNEAGVLYASAVCHGGWDKAPSGRDRRRAYRIPFQKADPDDGGHAFAMLGYDAYGFWILNSWGTNWGNGGLAVLSYEDWLENAMDCWVAQLGVATSLHQAVAAASTLRTVREDGAVRVTLASETVLRNREISPFVLDMANDGKLSGSGEFRTQPTDLQALATFHLDAFRRKHGIAEGEPVDLAIYAHGGLTGEDTAAATAARWIPALYEAKVFPIFFMWETDLWSTLKNRCQDVVTSFREGAARRTGGFRESMRRLWNQRLERTLAPVGRWIWDEMKDNAEKISSNEESGARLLYREFRKARLEPGNVRLHLVGHSAGAIVHSYLADVLVEAGWTVSTVTFLAPAVNIPTFERRLFPHLGKGVKRYVQFHLTEQAEEDDPTCKPILYYQRSLLHLVANSFEKARPTAVLGLARDFLPWLEKQPEGSRRLVRHTSSPGAQVQASTHGGFDDDPHCLRAVLDVVKGKMPPTAAARRRRAG